MAKKESKQAENKEKVSKEKVGKAKAAKKAKQTTEPNATDGFSANAFAQGTREELTKVIWPTRQQLISESAAVILMVSLSATIIYFVDKLFGWASRLIF
ncbi:MAG: preprotein translocase subunit SecE [Cyanobacteria bacterium P01_D01_bin.1]